MYSGFAVGVLLVLLSSPGTTLAQVQGREALPATRNIAPVSPELLREVGSGREVSFIIRFSDRTSLEDFDAQGADAQAGRRALIRSLRLTADRQQGRMNRVLQQVGASRLVQLWAINGIAVTAPADALPRLRRLPEVESITLDAQIAAPVSLSSVSAAPEWNLEAVRAPEFWAQGYDGTGVVVATMDTGVDPYHPDLAPRWRGGSNSWFDPHGVHATPFDHSGHGTASLGVILGGDSGGSAIGVAPGAEWIAVKIFDDDNVALVSDIHAGFQWLLDPDGDPFTDDAPQVLNNSWGYSLLLDQCFLEFEFDIQILKHAGISVVFSAGNNSLSESPANNHQGFSVGAVNNSLTVPTFSARGPSACSQLQFPHLVAPGVYIRVAGLTNYGQDPNAWLEAEGTSLAAPHVAGVLALLRGAYPFASVSLLEQTLKASAVDLVPAGNDTASGFGLVDVVAAAAQLDAAYPEPCADVDGDLFFNGLDCGTPLDCDDTDDGINPDACDIKRDGIDQDCDGRDRRRGGTDCPFDPADLIAENTPGTCSDQIDNDRDGRVDCLDSGCDASGMCLIVHGN